MRDPGKTVISLSTKRFIGWGDHDSDGTLDPFDSSPESFIFSRAMKFVVPVLIAIFMIIPGLNALPDAGTSVTPVDNSTIILDIKIPQENQIFSNDVVPHHIQVTGEVKSPEPLQSITVSSSEGSTNCGNQSSFSCDIVVAKGLDRIVVTVTDRDGNRVFRTRNIKVETGMPDLPPRITISGKITTPDDHPVEGATVRTEFSRPYDTKSVTVQSETDGTYRINNAYGYLQKISVEKEGYANVTKEMVFKENLNTVDFTLEPTTKPVSGFTTILGLGAITLIVLITIYRLPKAASR